MYKVTTCLVPFCGSAICIDMRHDVIERLFTLRCLGPCIDDPRVIERLFTLPPGVTIVRD
jgi:hypothetical protein